MLNLVKKHFCIYWNDHVIFALHSVCVLFYIPSLMYVKLSLNLWHETNLIMVYGLLNVLLNLACKYFMENFCIYVH
jgi:hypothetical protein